MINLKLVNIDPEDYILAVRAAKSFINERRPIGFKRGVVYAYGPMFEEANKTFYVYRTKTSIVVKTP